MKSDEVIEAFGARWTFDTSRLDPVAAERLRALWSACRVPGADPGDAGVEPFVVTDPDPYAVSRAVTLASLARRRGTAVLLHAAGFEREGRAVALVGQSGAGKSTAALTLGREFGYLSDETIAVESDGSISPYPKPVSVITDPSAPWDKHEESPDEVGLRKASGTAYLEVVVVLERDPAHATPELVELPLVDALLAIIPQSSSLPAIDRPLDRLAELASRSGGPYALRYSEIGACVDLVADLLEERPRPQRASWSTTPGRDDVVSPPEGTVVRAPWRDALHTEDGTIVLVGEQVIRLGPVGDALWRAAASPTSPATLHAAVVDALGPHPDAEAIVDAGIVELRRSGVLLPSA